MDLVTVAQAFHWFDRAAFRQECQRLLKPGGQVALIWNDRLTNTPFLKAYEGAARLLGDYGRSIIATSVEAHFSRLLHREYRLDRFENGQLFDLDGSAWTAQLLLLCACGDTPATIR